MIHSRSAARADGWTVLVMIKSLDQAKTRLRLEDGTRRRLALAMATDTVRAAVQCAAVDRAVVVTRDRVVAAMAQSLDAAVMPGEPPGDLDQAVRYAVSTALAHGSARIAVLPGDLPCATADTIAVGLTVAATMARSVLADADGTGTSLLATTDGSMEPRWGAGSFQRHQDAGARAIASAGLSRLRRDVDTLADLDAAVVLGVGAATGSVVAELDLLAGSLR